MSFFYFISFLFESSLIFFLKKNFKSLGENTKILKCFQDLHKIKLLEGTIIEPVEQDSIASDGTGSEDEEDEIENDQMDQIFKDLHAILLQDLNNEIEELQEKQSQEDSETSGDEFQLIDYK